MSEPRVVYMVSTGSYSDYGVECIFEARGDAEWYIEALDLSDARVEERELYRPGNLPTIYTNYSARFDSRHASEGVLVMSSRDTEEQKFTSDDRVYAGGHLYVYAAGPDRERVVKSVSDRVARWRAEGVGL